MPRSAACFWIGLIASLLQDRGHRGRVDHRPGDVDLLRGRQALNPRRDVDGLAEIILPLVEHHRETRPFVNADLDHEIVGAALGIERVHRRAHPQARDERMLGPDEGRHHGVADRLHHRALLRGDDLEQRAEMRAHQIERGEIADPFVQRGGALEVGEQERQRGDLQPLIDVEVVGLEDVAEGLVGQHPLGGQERLALADQMMERVARDEDRRQHAHAGLIVERQPQRARDAS